jgi:hypothetical protein
MVPFPTAPPPLPPQAEQAALHLARAIHDCAELRLADYLRDGDQDWVLVRLRPAPGSGGGAITAAGLVARVEGAWDRLAAAEEGGPTQGVYAWEHPLGPVRGGPGPEALYSPFVHGGLLLYRPEPQAEGAERFAAPRLVFGEWADAVMRKLPWAAERGALFSDQGAAERGEELAALMAGDSPLLAALAFRTLLEARRLPPGRVQAELDRASGPLRAVLAYLVLTRMAEERAYRDVLAAAVDGAGSADALSPLVRAAFAAGLFGHPRPVAEAARGVLTRARAKVETLDLDPAQAAELEWMLDRGGATALAPEP